MGRMVEGVWHSEEVMEMDQRGAWVRSETRFRNRLNSDGFAAKPGRYPLYVALNCPWAHRTIIYRKLKGLEDVASLSFVLPRRTEEGWVFDPDDEAYRDPLSGKRALHEVYSQADPVFSGRVTVPVLWDRQQGTIVNNESSEIIRMFNSAFDGLGAKELDLYPKDLRADIDALNERIYVTVNNGVYRCGFATTQQAYEEAFAQLGEDLGQRWDHAAKDDGLYIGGGDASDGQQVEQCQAVFVGHAARVSGQSPSGLEGIPLEYAQGDVGVAYVNGQKHHGRRILSPPVGSIITGMARG